MATSITNNDLKRIDRRNRVIISLSEDFLRVPSDIQVKTKLQFSKTNQNKIVPIEEQEAVALYGQKKPSLDIESLSKIGISNSKQCVRGRLLISVMQAKLAKNYGMIRMDPYVRLHIGHNVYETPTDVNGAKNPRWNKTIQCFLPLGITQIYIEVYDECSFSVDELIAYSHIQIPIQIFNGETTEEWYNLNGKQGDGKEGQILLVFSFMNIPTSLHQPSVFSFTRGQNQICENPNFSLPESNVQAVISRPLFQEEDFNQVNILALSKTRITQLKEMFTNIDEKVILYVYEASHYSKDDTVNSLLELAI